MKLLYTVYNLNNGGAEKILLNTLNMLVENTDFEVNVLLISKEGVYLEQLNKKVKVKYLYLGNDSYEYRKKNSISKLIYKIYRKLIQKLWCVIPNIIYKMLVRENYDIITSFSGGKINEFIGKLNVSSKRIIWIHSDVEKYKGFSFNNDRYLLENKFDKIISVAQTVEKNFLKKYPECSKKTLTIYNPIDFNQIINQSKVVVDYKKNEEDILICAVGRLEQVKGFDRLIKCIYLLRKEGYKVGACIVGDGSEKSNLQALINEYELQSFVNLVGYKENPYAYIKKSDVYVLSSYFEGLPTSLIEARIIKKPIVATLCSGVNEILECGKYGITVENSESGLYEGIKKFINDKSIIYEDDSIEKFSFNYVLSQIENLFFSLIN